jgi:hypothetical protein
VIADRMVLETRQMVEFGDPRQNPAAAEGRNIHAAW